MRYAPRDYQRRAIDEVKEKLIDNPCLVAPTGSGKSVMGAILAEEFNLPILWMTHRKELIEQAADHLRALGMYVGVIKSGIAPEPLAPVQVASVQTLVRREAPPAGLIIIDECFPAGTLIDGKPIETISVGDWVQCYDHTQNKIVRSRVTKTFRNRPTALCRISFNDGRKIVCTPNHPFFSKEFNCYIPAMSLQYNTVVLSITERYKHGDIQNDMQCMRNQIRGHLCAPNMLQKMRIHSEVPSQNPYFSSTLYSMWKICRMLRETWQRNGKKKTSFLFNRMYKNILFKNQFSNNGENKSQICFQKNETKQSNEKSGNQSKGFNHTSSNGLETSSTRGQRSNNNSSKVTGMCIGLANGGGNSYQTKKRTWITNSIQSGYWKCTTKNCNRSRWKQPSYFNWTRTRSQTRQTIKEIRVDCVEILEQTNTERFRRLCPDGFVYNLEVEHHHNYFAEGVLVHNCHHATASTYSSILEDYQNVPVVGLTATPFRLDGRGLGDIFGELVVAARPDELCDSGILHRPRVYASSVPDLKDIKITAGDYNLKSLAIRTNTSEANADIVGEWVEHAQDKRTVVFAVNIIHSQAITAAFVEAGIRAEHLDGGTAANQRNDILARLRTGETHVVSNCMVLTEGWDLPALECAVIARPTASLNLHLQMVGRIMRSCDGKNGALVLDHAGNHHRHGLVTRRLEYTLDGTRRVGTSEPLGLRRCRECGLYFETNLIACPECGWTPSVDDVGVRDLPAVHGDGVLSEFDDSTYEYRAEFWRITDQRRIDLDFAQNWTAVRFHERFGVWPVVSQCHLVDVDHATMDQKRDVYQQLVDTAEDRGFKPGWASWKYKEAFGCWPRGFVTDIHRERISNRFAEMKT